MFFKRGSECQGLLNKSLNVPPPWCCLTACSSAGVYAIEELAGISRHMAFPITCLEWDHKSYINTVRQTPWISGVCVQYNCGSHRFEGKVCLYTFLGTCGTYGTYIPFLNTKFPSSSNPTFGTIAALPARIHFLTGLVLFLWGIFLFWLCWCAWFFSLMEWLLRLRVAWDETKWVEFHVSWRLVLLRSGGEAFWYGVNAFHLSFLGVFFHSYC